MRQNVRLWSALLLSALLLSGCGGTQPTTATTSEQVKSVQSYDELLEAVQRGLDEQADVDYYEKLGVSECIITHTGGLDEDDNVIQAGYAVYDMDGDGQDELMLGIDCYEDPLILNVFSQSEDGICSVLNSREHDRYFLGENGEIYRFGEYDEGEGGSFYGKYAFSEGKLTFEEGIMYQEGWYFNDTTFDMEGAKPISEEKAMELSDLYWPVALTLTDFK